MGKLVIVVLLALASNAFAQAPRIDSMRIIREDSVAVLAIHGSFGTTLGSVKLDTESLIINAWSDTVIEVFVHEISYSGINGPGKCGRVSIEVSGKTSNSRTLTAGLFFGKSYINTDSLHSFYFEGHWRCDLQSYFLNHKDAHDDYPDSMYYGGRSTPIIWRFQQHNVGLDMSGYGLGWVSVGLDSNYLCKSNTRYRQGNWTVSTDATELCSPPMTSIAIYKGVTPLSPNDWSYVPDTTALDLHWEQSPFFDYYHLQVSTDSTFPTRFIDTTIAPFQFILPPLSSKATYYWRVAGINAEGQSRWSPVWRFSTQVDTTFLSSPRIDSMTFITDTFEASGILRISGSFGPSQGKVVFDTLAVPILSWGDSAVLVLLPSSGGQMRMRCGAVHVEVNNRSSNTRMITSGAAALQIMNDPYPEHATGFNLRWRVDLQSYFVNHKADHAPLRIKCAPGTDGTAVFDFENRRVNLSVSSYGSMPPLPMDSALDLAMSGTTKNGLYPYLNYDLYEFCNVPLTAVMIFRGPSLYLPPNNSPGQDSSGVQLQWVPSQYFDSYHLQVSTDSSFASVFVDTNLTQFVCTMPTLRFHTSYYWRVNGTNVEGTSRWSDVWKFTTDAALGVKPPNETVAFTCTPNPATSILNITLPAPARVVLYDLRGNVVRSIMTSEPSLMIETRDIAIGMYILGVTTSGMHGSQLVQILH